MQPLKHRLRLARRIEKAWTALPSRLPIRSDQIVDSLVEQISSLRETSRHLVNARTKGWSSAGKDLGITFSCQLDGLKNLTQRLAEETSAELRESSAAPDWLAEIDQIEAEFGDMSIDWQRACLSVNTEPIVLEEIDLGPFSIVFFWDRLGRHNGSGCFDIVALEPNPAACNEEVCHPHVRAGELCAGDASTPIRTALADGRIADAVLLVQSVLMAYNPGSPFVSLDHWSGTACHDCGTVEIPDELSYCEGCDGDFCESCFSSCTACDRYRCLECLSRCDVCQARCCPGCLEVSEISDRDCCPECRTSCSACNQTVVHDEIVEGTDKCTECNAAPDNSKELTPTTSQEICHESASIVQSPASAPGNPDLCPAGVAEAPILLSPG